MKGRGGNHLQFNTVPIPMAAASQAKEALFAAAKEHNITFKEVSKSQKVGGAFYLPSETKGDNFEPDI